MYEVEHIVLLTALAIYQCSPYRYSQNDKQFKVQLYMELLLHFIVFFQVSAI